MCFHHGGSFENTFKWCLHKFVRKLAFFTIISKMAFGVSTSIDVVFDGYFGSEIRGEVLKEFVKYILYQRNQIPMYFDQIKELLHRSSNTVMLEKPQAVKRASSMDDQVRLVQSVNNLFQIIQSVFASGEIIKEVLIILGSSIFTPKETYLLTFPVDFFEGRVLSRQAGIQHLFRTLFTADFLGSSKLLKSCTNLFVLVLASRKCNHIQLNLTPRLSYKVPCIGARYAVNVIFNGSSVTHTSPSLNLEGDDLDISGIRPLELSGLDDSLKDSGSPVKTESCAGSWGHSDQEHDLVWFEVPVTIKGYKDKPT